MIFSIFFILFKYETLSYLNYHKDNANSDECTAVWIHYVRHFVVASL